MNKIIKKKRDLSKLLGQKTPDDDQQDAPRYVSFQGRINASLIDSVIIMALITPIFNFIVEFFSSSESESLENARQKIMTGNMDSSELVQVIQNYYLYEGGAAKILSETLFFSSILGVIMIYLWIKKGATPGKMLLSMKIVDADSLEELTITQSIKRYLGYFVSVITLFIGFLWVAIDKRKQGFHDKIANSVVIYTKPEDPEAKEKKFKRQTIAAIIMVIVFVIYIFHFK